MKTYQLLADEAYYSRRPGPAQTPLGHPVPARSPLAVRWSLGGAVACCYDYPQALHVMAALEAACRGYPGGCIAWGRQADFEEVVDLLTVLDI